MERLNKEIVREIVQNNWNFFFTDKKTIYYLGFFDNNIYILRDDELIIINTDIPEIVETFIYLRKIGNENQWHYFHSNSHMMFINSNQIWYFNNRELNNKTPIQIGNDIKGIFCEEGKETFLIISPNSIIQSDYISFTQRHIIFIPETRYGRGYIIRDNSYLLLLNVNSTLHILRIKTMQIEINIKLSHYYPSLPIIIKNDAIFFRYYHSIIYIRLFDYKPIRIHLKEDNLSLSIREISSEKGFIYIY